MLAAASSPLWYLTRGSGLVSMVLLTASVVLGIMNLSAFSPPRWPRFVTAGLHRNISLLVVVMVAIHVVTAELDTFAPVGWPAVLIPFASTYRPLWLGLGTVASDLLVALVITSLLRNRLGQRAWRALHWTAYACWPVAILHGLGTGTDQRLGWVLFLTILCTLAVIAAGIWRLVHGWPQDAGRRLAAGATGLATIIGASVWAAQGPLQPGWARRAGTPASLLGAGIDPAVGGVSADTADRAPEVPPTATSGAAEAALAARPTPGGTAVDGRG